jgi:hypothetical protein
LQRMAQTLGDGSRVLFAHQGEVRKGNKYVLWYLARVLPPDIPGEYAPGWFVGYILTPWNLRRARETAPQQVTFDSIKNFLRGKTLAPPLLQAIFPAPAEHVFADIETALNMSFKDLDKKRNAEEMMKFSVSGVLGIDWGSALVDEVVHDPERSKNLPEEFMRVVDALTNIATQAGKTLPRFPVPSEEEAVGVMTKWAQDTLS